MPTEPTPSDAVAPSRAPVQFYRPHSYEAHESVGWLIKRIMSLLSPEIDRQLGEHDLTNAQWMPLFKLAKGCRGTVAELARECQVDNGGMTRMLDRLEAKGFVNRVRSTTDRRVVNLELTPDGRAAADRIPEVLADVMNGYLAGFSREEWLALRGYLQRVLENAEAMRARGTANENPNP